MTSEPTDNIVVSMHDNPERFPYTFIRGSLANLSALRGTDADTQSSFLEERNANPIALESDAPASFLESPIEAKLVVTSQSDEEQVFGGDDENEEHDGDENDEPEPISTTPPTPIQGTIFVSNTQVLFVAKEVDDCDADTAAGGATIILHALSDDPEPSLYLQLQNDSGDTMEMTIIANQDDCQRLFDALCKLISLHPIENDDEDGCGMMGGMMGGGFGDDRFADYGEADWITANDDDAPSATQAEREAMLERLDDMLVVAPGLEKDDDDDGQFEDAPEA